MIGRALWWLVRRVWEVPAITEAMLDAVDQAILEEAGS